MQASTSTQPASGRRRSGRQSARQKSVRQKSGGQRLAGQTDPPCPPQPALHDHAAEWAESAHQAGLRYVTDARPGLTRKRTAKGFRYVDAQGRPIKDAETLRRIRSLVLPPAWSSVWICPAENGHLQATGRDARGRKQSRYHPKWRSVRDETKYDRMKAFGAVLPKLRARVDKDLALPGIPRDKVLATLIRLMETTYIRVGNEEYARTNHSYGLTTMRRRHVQIKGAEATFVFRGKSGVEHTVAVRDARLARNLKRSYDLPGYALFEYLDHEGQPRTVDSADVNDYLHRVTGDRFTAKDFRTWAGTVLAASLLEEFDPFETAAQARKNVVQTVAAVAARLGNTPSVCRKCYIHPAILSRYLDGPRAEEARSKPATNRARSKLALLPAEQAMLTLLAGLPDQPKTLNAALRQSLKQAPG